MLQIKYNCLWHGALQQKLTNDVSFDLRIMSLFQYLAIVVRENNTVKYYRRIRSL